MKPPLHTKRLKCANPTCHEILDVSQDCIRVTCGRCILGGFRLPRLVTPDLFTNDQRPMTNDQMVEVAA